MNTDNNSLAENLERMARDMEYPPLNGGPTQEEIIGALKAAADIVGEYEDETDEREESAERVEELEEVIQETYDNVDDLLITLSLAVKSGELPDNKTTDDIQKTLMEIRSDLRRA